MAAVPDAKGNGNPRDEVHRPARSSQLNIVGIGLITATVVFTALHLLDQADQNHMVQVAVLLALFSTTMILMYFHRFNTQRRRADAALEECAVARKDENRFRTLTENSADVIMIAAAPGEIAYLSPSVGSVLGWK